MNLENYMTWFLNYVDKFGNEPKIILKKEHSLRVAENMNNIFNKIGFTDDYVLLAHFLGLYHDIGRFKQWQVYHTFYDSKSVDHADYSADNLIKEGLINEIISKRDYDLLIYNAIKYHNKLLLPANLSIKDEQIFSAKMNLDDTIKYSFDSVTSLYSMAIRDADKLDILKQYLLSDYFLKTDHLPVSDNVSTSFFNNQNINKEDRKNLNDVLVLRLSFINDINLTEALRIIKKTDLLQKIYEVYPDKKNTELFFEYADSRLDQLITNNCSHQYVLIK